MIRIDYVESGSGEPVLFIQAPTARLRPGGRSRSCCRHAGGSSARACAATGRRKRRARSMTPRWLTRCVSSSMRLAAPAGGPCIWSATRSAPPWRWPAPGRAPCRWPAWHCSKPTPSCCCGTGRITRSSTTPGGSDATSRRRCARANAMRRPGSSTSGAGPARSRPCRPPCRTTAGQPLRPTCSIGAVSSVSNSAQRTVPYWMCRCCSCGGRLRTPPWSP